MLAMPPTHSSSACVVVPVVPVEGEVELPVVSAVIRSRAPLVAMPEYSTTTAEAFMLVARLMVMPVAAPETFKAYQISTVTPLALVDCVARCQEAPVCEMLVTRLALVPRVPMTAIKALPFTGAGLMVTATVDTVPSLKPALSCTRAIAARAGDGRQRVAHPHRMETIRNRATVERVEPLRVAGREALGGEARRTGREETRPFVSRGMAASGRLGVRLGLFRMHPQPPTGGHDQGV